MFCRILFCFPRPLEMIVYYNALLLGSITLHAGFFGRKLRRATEDLPCIESSKDTHTFRKWAKRFIRFVYSCNVCLGIIYLTYLTIKQQEGSYRCTKILLAFGDELWEDAYVTTAENGLPERRLLIYSHFNGIYEEDGEVIRYSCGFVC